MNIILLGSPGSGKGTQARLLQEKFGLIQISTGNILRHAVSAGTPLGLEAKSYMEKGELAPDPIIFQILKEQIQQFKNKAGFVLDGVPRNFAQAKALDKMLKELGIALTAVVEIKVPLPVILERLALRKNSEQRVDDKVKVIEKRVQIYEEETRPLVQYYKEKGLLISIDGSQPASKVSEVLYDCLKVKR